MTEIELLQDQIRTLEMRIVALEQAVKVLRGHAIDEITAPDFHGLWAVLVHICPPAKWDELRLLYQQLIERWAPDNLDVACAWLNEPADALDHLRPIDLIMRGDVRAVEGALASLPSELPSEAVAH